MAITYKTIERFTGKVADLLSELDTIKDIKQEVLDNAFDREASQSVIERLEQQVSTLEDALESLQECIDILENYDA